MKIVQINGFKGIITAILVISCLFAGFIIFPGYVAMSLWNKYLVSSFNFPIINIYQGILLWGISITSYVIVDNKGFALCFKNGSELSDSEINMIMKNAKIYSDMRKINKIITQKDSFEKSKHTINKDLSSVIPSKKEDNEDSVSNLK